MKWIPRLLPYAIEHSNLNDRLLVALLAHHYAGNLRAKHEIAKPATEHGIKVTSFYWP